MSQIDTEIDKNPKKIIFFNGFMHFSQVFDRLHELDHWNGSTREAFVVQVSKSSNLRNEINAAFQTGTDIEKDKISEIFGFPLLLFNFC